MLWELYNLHEFIGNIVQQCFALYTFEHRVTDLFQKDTAGIE